MNVVAYGSLMDQPCLEATLRRPATLTPITIPGWRRVFNAAFPDGLSYLNIMPALSGQLEAAYFTIEPAELALFADREAGSELVEVMHGYHAFVWPARACRELPVLRSYLDVCRRGAAGLATWTSAPLGRRPFVTIPPGRSTVSTVTTVSDAGRHPDDPAVTAHRGPVRGRALAAPAGGPVRAGHQPGDR